MSPSIRKRITAPEPDPKDTAEKNDNAKNSAVDKKENEEKSSSKDTSIAVIKNIETKTGGKVKIIKKERKRITAPSPEKPKPSPSIGTYEKEALKM